MSTKCILTIQSNLDTILQPIVNPLTRVIGQNINLIYDSARTYTARNLTNNLGKEVFAVLLRPEKSVDLNPIWYVQLNSDLRILKFREPVKRNWATLPQCDEDNLILSKIKVI